MHRDWSHYVDRLRDDIWQNHSRIHIVDFDFYSVDVPAAEIFPINCWC